MKIVTEKWLKEKGACDEGMKWFLRKKEKRVAPLMEALITYGDKDSDGLNWANWLIVRVMDYKQRVSYSVYAAEQVIGLYEKKYPNDRRPREAIEAAKACIENPSKENKAAAYAAADAATNSAYVAYAAYAAYAAAYAAYAAANVAYAAYAAAANKKTMKIKILRHGIKLWEGE